MIYIFTKKKIQTNNYVSTFTVIVRVLMQHTAT